MNFEPVALKLQVRPNDLDSLGHVNNATVLEYLEAARWAWLDHHNLRRNSHIIPVVARVEVNYKREIPPGEVTVIAKPESVDDMQRYQVVFCQSVEIIKDGVSTVVADARVKVAFVDSSSRRLRSLQDFLEENNS